MTLKAGVPASGLASWTHCCSSVHAGRGRCGCSTCTPHPWFRQHWPAPPSRPHRQQPERLACRSHANQAAVRHQQTGGSMAMQKASAAPPAASGLGDSSDAGNDAPSSRMQQRRQGQACAAQQSPLHAMQPQQKARQPGLLAGSGDGRQQYGDWVLQAGWWQRKLTQTACSQNKHACKLGLHGGCLCCSLLCSLGSRAWRAGVCAEGARNLPSRPPDITCPPPITTPCSRSLPPTHPRVAHNSRRWRRPERG